MTGYSFRDEVILIQKNANEVCGDYRTFGSDDGEILTGGISKCEREIVRGWGTELVVVGALQSSAPRNK